MTCPRRPGRRGRHTFPRDGEPSSLARAAIVECRPPAASDRSRPTRSTRGGTHNARRGGFGVARGADPASDADRDELVASRVTACVARILRERFPNGDADIAAEYVSCDVADPGVPADRDAARERWEDILPDVFREDDDTTPACTRRSSTPSSRRPRPTTRATSSRGTKCALCERETQLTRHHVFPRSEWQRWKLRPASPRAEA